MKDYQGVKTSQLLEYYIDKKESMNKSSVKALKELVNQIALYEALELLKKTEEDPIYTIEDICEIFDFKYNFVRNNIMKNPYFISQTINYNVKQMIIQLGKTEPGNEISSDIEANEYMDKSPISISLNNHHIETCQTITKKKTLIFRSDLAVLVSQNFFLSIKGNVISLPYEGSLDLIKSQWKSPRTIKENLGLTHDSQVHRLLKKENHYYKLVYIHYNSQEKHVTRYLKV